MDLESVIMKFYEKDVWVNSQNRYLVNMTVSMTNVKKI